MFACGGHVASFSKPFILQVHSDSYAIYAPDSVSVISEFFLLSELLPPCSFDTTHSLLLCCSASSDTDCVSLLLVLLITSKSSKIWRYGLWPLTWVALRRVFHVFMSQSNTRLDGVFWNYIVNMFSELIRKVNGSTGFSFWSICLHRCDGKNFSNTISRSLIVGKKTWYCNFLFCFGKDITNKETLIIFSLLHFPAVKPKKCESWRSKDFRNCCCQTVLHSQAVLVRSLESWLLLVTEVHSWEDVVAASCKRVHAL